MRRPELLGRAILVALGVAVALYAAVAVALLLVLGDRLPDSATPLAAAMDAVGAAWAEPVVRVGAATASLVIAGAIVVLILVADLRRAIGLSSCGVPVYYAVANLAALRQPAEQRRWPRAINLVGLVGCLTLVATLLAIAVIGGLTVLAVGVVGRAVLRPSS